MGIKYKVIKSFVCMYLFSFAYNFLLPFSVAQNLTLGLIHTRAQVACNMNEYATKN